ncbi:MAG: phytanoyl-CoA dioxygenase family protein [Pseudomonadota bacterium]
MNTEKYSWKPELKHRLKNEGYIHLKNFFSKKEINDICYLIYQLIGYIILSNKLHINRNRYSMEIFDSAYMDLITTNEKFHRIIYDAVKNLPGLISIISSGKSISLATYLLETPHIGIAHRSYGIRIDKPFDNIFMTDWHQDFHSHARAKKGLVFWVPISAYSPDIGMLKILKSSHIHGPRKVRKLIDIALDKTEYTKKANSIKIEKIDKILEKSKVILIEASQRDLVIFDYMTVHRSGYNRSSRCRWSIQARYFSFEDEWGINMGWPGSITCGKSYEEIIPELIVV